MTQREATVDKPEKSSSSASSSNPKFTPSAGQIGTIAKKRTEEIVHFQSLILDELQQANQHWMKRMQSEVALASECCAELVAAHSIPESATVCQHWADKRMRLAAEDANYVLSESQKLMKAGTHLLSNSWLTGGQSPGR